MSIVLVGRDWLTRVLLRAQLEEEGYHVSGYESPSEVVLPLHMGFLPTDLLIVDTMGLAAGDAELQKIRDAAPGVPVLVLTGPFDAARMHFSKMGLENVLVRPFFVRDVVTRIKSILSKSRHGQAG